MVMIAKLGAAAVIATAVAAEGYGRNFERATESTFSPIAGLECHDVNTLLYVDRLRPGVWRDKIVLPFYQWRGTCDLGHRVADLD